VAREVRGRAARHRGSPGRNGDPALVRRYHASLQSSDVVRGGVQKTRAREDRARIPFEINVVRIGDLAFATNPFELYLDYGIRIRARSKAVQTAIVQLAGYGTYLPTVRAVAGRSYGAIPASTFVGPEGGQELVERTLEMIQALWDKV